MKTIVLNNKPLIIYIRNTHTSTKVEKTTNVSNVTEKVLMYIANLKGHSSQMLHYYLDLVSMNYHWAYHSGLTVGMGHRGRQCAFHLVAKSAYNDVNSKTDWRLHAVGCYSLFVLC